MSPAVLLLLAFAPLEHPRVPPPVYPAGVAVRAQVSAEIMRVGRVGGDAGSEDIAAPLRTDRDGRRIAEFR